MGDARYYFIDTSFSSLRHYHTFNNSFTDLFGYNELGNLGSALNPIVYHSDANVWNYSDLGAYREYFPSAEDVPFFHVRSPLTEANYRMGYNRGHSFRIYHTQNITPNWNFLVRYKRLNALGQYNHNRNTQSVLLANSHYTSKDKSYSIRGYILHSKLEIQENGGIANDTAFEATNPQNKLLVEMNLPESPAGPGDERIIRRQEFFVDQNYDLLDLIRVLGEDDIEKSDSAEAKAGKENKLLALGHSARYTRTTKTYRGYSNNYYDEYFLTENSYTDSIAQYEFENTLYLKTELGAAKNFMFKAGFRQLSIAYGNEAVDITFNNLGVTGETYGRISDRLNVRASGDLIFLGDLGGAFNIDGTLDLRLFKSFHAYGGILLSNKLPSLYKQFYRSNNFIWNNSFSPEGIQKVEYGIRWKETSRLTLTNSRHTGFIFYDAEGYPAQAQDPVNIFKADLTQNFTFWNFLHQDNRVVYQQVLGNAAETLPLPELVTRNSLYFEFSMFKRALKVLAGTEVKYFTSYLSPSYNPAIGDFYVANEKEIGDYPVLDLFVNFKIRKAQIFVKYQHVNQGYTGFDFYAAPRYPFADRTLRVGITWRFFN